MNDLLTSPLHPPVIDPEINESRVKEINEAVVRSERLLKEGEGGRRRGSNLEARRQQAMQEIAEVGNMMAAKKKGGFKRDKRTETAFFERERERDRERQRDEIGKVRQKEEESGKVRQKER